MTETFQALVSETASDGRHSRGVREMPLDGLAPDGVLIDVAWSSVNFKDALAASPKGRVARISPLIGGIDLAGTVRESTAPDVSPGDEVIAHGYDLGVSHHGGLSEVARVPADWVVPLPDGITLRDAMVIGTAGYTAALSVLALLEHGIAPGSGPVLVTGASGGVGSAAVDMLAGLGFDVTAASGKPEAEKFLRELGANQVLSRAELTSSTKPLLPATWQAAVDVVGGATLAHVIAGLVPGGAATACGNVGGNDLSTTVLPFILRGVSLYGIDSVMTPIDQRRSVWARLAGDIKPRHLETVATEVGLDSVEAALDEIGSGGTTGRYVVRTR